MSQKVRSYRELQIWRKGIELVKVVYKMTRKFPSYETYALVNQLQRAAVSIPSNIAEGQARQHPAEFRQFLYTALGSASEVDTQTIIAQELGYITQEEATEVAERIIELRKMIYTLVSRISG